MTIVWLGGTITTLGLMTLLKIGILLCTACSTSVLTDDQVADLVRRIELLSSRESAGPRIATLVQASALLKSSFPDVSARFAAEARRIAPPPAGQAADRAPVEREVSGPALEAAALTFLRAVESGGENPSDYDWFAALRTRRDIVAGSDNPSVRVRQVLAELAELVRTDLDFELRDLSGGHARLRDYRGRTVLVTFWATWCAPCQEEMPLFEKLWRDHRVAVLAITDEPAEVVRDFVADNHLTLRVLLDPGRTAAGMFQIDAMPGTILFDGTGRARARLHRTNAEQLNQLLENLSPTSSSVRSPF